MSNEIGDASNLVPLMPTVPDVRSQNPFREPARLREVGRATDGKHIIVKPAPNWTLNNVGDLVHDILDRLAEVEREIDRQRLYNRPSVHVQEYDDSEMRSDLVENMRVIQEGLTKTKRHLEFLEKPDRKCFEYMMLLLIFIGICVLVVGSLKTDFGYNFKI